MKKELKAILLCTLAILLASYGISYTREIHMEETILIDYTFSEDQHTYDYASIMDFYHKKHPDSTKGGVHIGTNPHWPDSLSWSHTLPDGLCVPPCLITRAKLWIDAKGVNTDQNTVEIQGTYTWDPLNHRIHDDTIYDLLGVAEEGFWNQGALNVIVRAGESQIRIDEAILLIDYESVHTDVEEDESASQIEDFELSQNYPNPFNPETHISFSLPKRKEVSLEVYNVYGQKVRTLLNTTLPVGWYKVTWDGKDDEGISVASGVYFYRLLAGDKMYTKKMILMK
ncbi:MAG: T9SS type A sorting domain-containing protein [Candidatus Zixiibacteriota bacterium]